MSDDSQIVIPASFIALFVPPGRSRPSASRTLIAERHEFCEDLACALTETAQIQLHDLGVTEADVLQRIHQGLVHAPDGQALCSAAEAWWVSGRLAELLGWAVADTALPPPAA
jgi:hypothetical protein